MIPKHNITFDPTTRTVHFPTQRKYAYRLIPNFPQFFRPPPLSRPRAATGTTLGFIASRKIRDFHTAGTRAFLPPDKPGGWNFPWKFKITTRNFINGLSVRPFMPRCTPTRPLFAFRPFNYSILYKKICIKVCIMKVKW